MSVTGLISGKTIRLDEAPGLPDGSRVRVEVEVLAERSGLSKEERVALVERTRGMIPATEDQIRAALDADPYGAE